MVRMAANKILPASSANAALMADHITANVNDVDDFVTAEPTPKMESRRGWRRRRVRRGKS